MNHNYVPTSKPHYEILDGLRGIAAIMVLIFHILEAFTVITGKYPIIGHGYLAVDFFFVLSGFVIGYAYDDRWGKMSFGTFIKRRLVRLHPMVIFGTILGAALFYFGASPVFSLIAGTPVWKVVLFAILGILMIPMPPSADIRGWQEMYTLDAPTWTLFFEYIANILYGLFIRRFSKIALAVLVFLSACGIIYLTVFTQQGDVSGGWTFNGKHMYMGFTRLLYPFFAGLLLYRTGKLKRVKNAFLWCSLLLIVILIIPRLGDKQHVWMNGLYESFIILLAFPLIVYLGASGELKSKRSSQICRFLGDISYPVYLINYPIIYIFTGWVSNTKSTVGESLWQALLTFVVTIAISYISMKCFDKPVRNWLKRKFLK